MRTDRLCYIAGAEEIAPALAPPPGSFVIAADAGVNRLAALGAVPDLIVGDFDSLGTIPEGDRVIRHPVRKDDTDTMLAVRIGLARGMRRFRICGGMGGRLDHTLANLQTLLFIAARGGRGVLTDGEASMTVIRNGTALLRGGSGTLSVFAVGGPARGVTLRGTDYTLEDAELLPEMPLGVSNRFTAHPAEIAVRRGALAVYWQGGPDILTEQERQRANEDTGRDI